MQSQCSPVISSVSTQLSWKLKSSNQSFNPTSTPPLRSGAAAG